MRLNLCLSYQSTQHIALNIQVMNANNTEISRNGCLYESLHEFQ